MANSVKKTASKLDFEILGIVQNNKNGTHEVEFKVKNPIGGFASIKNIRYKSPDDGAYYNASFFATQLNGFDKDTFKADPKFKNYKVVWDSIKDLRMHQDFNSVVFELTLSDDINGSGTNSESRTFSTPVKFALKEVYIVTKPRSNQEDLKFQFYTPKLLRSAKVHYQIKVDTSATFNSGDLQVYKSQDNQNGWTYKDGNTQPNYPTLGIDGGPSTTTEVYFEHSALNNLANGTYYFEVMPIPTQFFADITSPVNGAVFNSTTITISGTLTSY